MPPKQWCSKGDNRLILFWAGVDAQRFSGLSKAIMIDDFPNLRGNFKFLESSHNYVQWVFPLHSKSGSNDDAPVLSHGFWEKVTDMRHCSMSTLVQRVIEPNISTMLHFYGYHLVRTSSGHYKIRQNAHTFAERNKNLHAHQHNNLRITRLIKFCNSTPGLRQLGEQIATVFSKDNRGTGSNWKISRGFWIEAAYGRQDGKKEPQRAPQASPHVVLCARCKRQITREDQEEEAPKTHRWASLRDRMFWDSN